VTETTVAEPVVVEKTETKPGYAGTNVPRKEDKRLVQGEGVFFDDVKRHNMGYVHFVRSPYAHAKIRSVDVSKALEHPGVLGTLTGDEVALLTDPFFQISSPPGAHLKDFCLAVGKARFVGEPVAAVVATTRETARDASELVEIDYEPLPAVADVEAALADETGPADGEAEVLQVRARRRGDLEERVSQERDLVPCQRPEDTRMLQRLRNVHRADLRVGVRRADEVDVAHVVPLDVVEEDALALNEPPVLLARHALAGVPGLRLGLLGDERLGDRRCLAHSPTSWPEAALTALKMFQ